MLQNVAKYGKKGCCKTQDLKGDHATHGKTWERREACHLPVPSHRLLVSLVDGDHIEEAHFGFGQTVHVGRQQETHPGAQKARQHWPEKEVDFTLPRIQPRKKTTESPKRTLGSIFQTNKTCRCQHELRYTSILCQHVNMASIRGHCLHTVCGVGHCVRP
jgi:hypothetical protein